MPEQFFVFLGALKLRAIIGTLFSNFGEEAILDRAGDAGASVIITKKKFSEKDFPHQGQASGASLYYRG